MNLQKNTNGVSGARAVSFITNAHSKIALNEVGLALSNFYALRKRPLSPQRYSFTVYQLRFRHKGAMIC